MAMRHTDERSEQFAQRTRRCCRWLQRARVHESRLVQYFAAAAIVAFSSAFTWPGRTTHLTYEAAHGSPAQRIAAVRWLEHNPSPATTRALLLALEDAEPAVRLQAAASIGHAGVVDAVPTLLEWLAAHEEQPRLQAVVTLGFLRDLRARAGLEQALHDPHVELRLAAIAAWSENARADAAGYETLAGALDDPDLSVRSAATLALANASAEQLQAWPAGTRGAVVTKLQARVDPHDPELFAAQLRVLSRLNDARTLRTLTRGLSEREPALKLAAIAALGDSGSSGSTNALRSPLNEEPRIARAALAALGRSADPAAATVIATQLSRTPLTQAAVAALLVHARRLHQPAIWQKTADVLCQRVVQTRDGTQLTALAHGLSALTSFADIRAAEPALLAALREGHGEPEPIARVLLALHSQTLLATLSERLLGGDEGVAGALALVARTLAPETPAAASGAWAARLAQTSGETRLRTLELLALLRAEVTWQPAPTASPAELAAFADLLGALPDATERRHQLLGMLAHTDAGVREHAALALARSATPGVVSILVDHLTQPHGAHESSLLLALAGALTRLDQGRQLSRAERERIFDQLAGPRLTAADGQVAAATLLALRALDDARTTPLVARLLRTGSANRRAAAMLALGDSSSPDARSLLRYLLLQRDAPQAALNASLALAEVGTERDAEALLHAAERGSWPQPGAAAYALARIANRGVVKRHSFSSVLCRLGQHADPYVRANVAAGLAALGAAACDATVAPGAWLAADQPSALRVAAAHWLRAAPVLGNAEAARARQLADCSDDPDPWVARACLEPTSRPTRQRLLVQARMLQEGPTRQAAQQRIVAIRLPDATVYVGPSDADGRVLLPNVTRGELALEDPTDIPPSQRQSR